MGDRKGGKNVNYRKDLNTVKRNFLGVPHGDIDQNNVSFFQEDAYSVSDPRQQSSLTQGANNAGVNSLEMYENNKSSDECHNEFLACNGNKRQDRDKNIGKEEKRRVCKFESRALYPNHKLIYRGDHSTGKENCVPVRPMTMSFENTTHAYMNNLEKEDIIQYYDNNEYMASMANSGIDRSAKTGNLVQPNMKASRSLDSLSHFSPSKPHNGHSRATGLRIASNPDGQKTAAVARFFETEKPLDSSAKRNLHLNFSNSLIRNRNSVDIDSPSSHSTLQSPIYKYNDKENVKNTQRIKHMKEKSGLKSLESCYSPAESTCYEKDTECSKCCSKNYQQLKSSRKYHVCRHSQNQNMSVSSPASKTLRHYNSQDCVQINISPELQDHMGKQNASHLQRRKKSKPVNTVKKDKQKRGSFSSSDENDALFNGIVPNAQNIRAKQLTTAVFDSENCMIFNNSKHSSSESNLSFDGQEEEKINVSNPKFNITVSAPQAADNEKYETLSISNEEIKLRNMACSQHALTSSEANIFGNQSGSDTVDDLLTSRDPASFPNQHLQRPANRQRNKSFGNTGYYTAADLPDLDQPSAYNEHTMYHTAAFQSPVLSQNNGASQTLGLTSIPSFGNQTQYFDGLCGDEFDDENGLLSPLEKASFDQEEVNKTLSVDENESEIFLSPTPSITSPKALGSVSNKEDGTSKIKRTSARKMKRWDSLDELMLDHPTNTLYYDAYVPGPEDYLEEIPDPNSKLDIKRNSLTNDVNSANAVDSDQQAIGLDLSLDGHIKPGTDSDDSPLSLDDPDSVPDLANAMQQVLDNVKSMEAKEKEKLSKIRSSLGNSKGTDRPKSMANVSTHSSLFTPPSSLFARSADDISIPSNSFKRLSTPVTQSYLSSKPTTSKPDRTSNRRIKRQVFADNLPLPHILHGQKTDMVNTSDTKSATVLKSTQSLRSNGPQRKSSTRKVQLNKPLPPLPRNLMGTIGEDESPTTDAAGGTTSSTTSNNGQTSETQNLKLLTGKNNSIPRSKESSSLNVYLNPAATSKSKGEIDEDVSLPTPTVSSYSSSLSASSPSSSASRLTAKKDYLNSAATPIDNKKETGLHSKLKKHGGIPGLGFTKETQIWKEEEAVEKQRSKWLKSRKEKTNSRVQQYYNKTHRLQLSEVEIDDSFSSFADPNLWTLDSFDNDDDSITKDKTSTRTISMSTPKTFGSLHFNPSSPAFNHRSKHPAKASRKLQIQLSPELIYAIAAAKRGLLRSSLYLRESGSSYDPNLAPNRQSLGIGSCLNNATMTEKGLILCMAPMALDLAVEELNIQSSKPLRLRRQQRLKCMGESSTAKHQSSVGVDKNRTGGPPLIKIGNDGPGFWESSQNSVRGTSGALKIRGCGSMDTTKSRFSTHNRSTSLTTTQPPTQLFISQTATTNLPIPLHDDLNSRDPVTASASLNPPPNLKTTKRAHFFRRLFGGSSVEGNSNSNSNSEHDDEGLKQASATSPLSVDAASGSNQVSSSLPAPTLTRNKHRSSHLLLETSNKNKHANSSPSHPASDTETSSNDNTDTNNNLKLPTSTPKSSRSLINVSPFPSSFI